MVQQYDQRRATKFVVENVMVHASHVMDSILVQESFPLNLITSICNFYDGY